MWLGSGGAAEGGALSEGVTDEQRGHGNGKGERGGEGETEGYGAGERKRRETETQEEEWEARGVIEMEMGHARG